ncbi:MAG: hypothetical protein ABIH65_02945 [Nanoarchaeota archaeon]
MVEENLIHVKFEDSEAILAKRGILSSQMILLRIAKAIRGYNFYRTKELELKLLLYKKIKELQTNIGQLQKNLPKPKTPSILKKVEEEEKEFKKSKVKTYDRSLEEQLQEIENKLNQLQDRGI